MNRAQRLHQRLGFAAMIFHAPPTDKGGTSEKPLSLEDKLTAAEKARDAVTKERDDLKVERDTIQTQFNSLTTTAKKSADDLKASQDANNLLTKENTDLKSESVKDKANVSRLEALCDIKGASRSEAPPTIEQPAAKLTVADFDAKLNAATTPKAKQAVIAEMEKAYAEGRIA